MKVLVTEDDPKTSEYVGTGLIAEGHSVDCVADGREALTYCLYSNCDVVVLDRILPGMDGLAVSKAFCASGNQTPVIFLTALADIEDRVQGLNAGSNDYLTKPFHLSKYQAP